MRTLKNLFLAAGIVAFGAANAQDIIAQDFYSNGKLRATRFSDGRVERFMNYYESGRVKEVGSFREGRRDGEWKQFAENGVVLARAEFRSGIRQGTWEILDTRNGSMGRLHFADGRLAQGEQYDPNGELIAQRTY